MKRFLPIAVLSLVLVACVDTTGISPNLSRGPHPNTNPNAVVTVTEFADLQCPSCKASYELVVKPLVEKYGTKIRFDFIHFPIRSIHRYALEAAEASECAADQGKFWEFVDVDYTNQEQMSPTKIRQWAQSLGLDMSIFDRCTKSHIKRAQILAEYDKGVSLGINGTPTYVVNGQIIGTADLDTLSKAIDAAMAGAKKKL